MFPKRNLFKTLLLILIRDYWIHLLPMEYSINQNGRGVVVGEEEGIL